MSYLGRTGKLSQRAYNKLSFLATAGQTVKAGLSYVAGFVEVYVNGTLLTDVVDYSASNGNSVTFLVALSVNDEVTVVSLKTFVAANMLPLSGGTLNGDLDVTGSVTVDGLVVDGATDLNGDLDVTGGDIKLTNTTSNESKIYFTHSPTEDRRAYIGALETDGNGNSLIFASNANGTDGVERARIDSSGNLLVGKTSNVFGDVGAAIRSPSSLGSLITLTKSGENVAAFNRLASDGSVVTFSKDNTTVGVIGTNGGTPYFLKTTGGIAIGNTSFLSAGSDGAKSDATSDLGGTSNRWKDLHLSGGVVFGDASSSGTSSSNTLDSYEEGTWTPLFEGKTTAGAYSTYTALGSYTKVGNLVTVGGYVDGSGGSGSGYLVLRGLPFSVTGFMAAYPFQCNGGAGIPDQVGGNPIAGIAWLWNNIPTEFMCRAFTGFGYVNLEYPTAPSYFRFSMSYYTDS
jgi:hypothetical protein